MKLHVIAYDQYQHGRYSWEKSPSTPNQILAAIRSLAKEARGQSFNIFTNASTIHDIVFDGRKFVVGEVYTRRRDGLNDYDWLLSGKAIGHTGKELVSYYGVGQPVHTQNIAGQIIWYFGTGVSIQVIFANGRVAQVNRY